MSPPAKNESSSGSKTYQHLNAPGTPVNTEMMGTLGETGSAYLRGVVSLNREIVDFINKRLGHDAELSHALGQCKDWKEAAELQQEWVREASEEYADNVRKLMKLTTKMMNDTWAPFKHAEVPGSVDTGN